MAFEEEIIMVGSHQCHVVTDERDPRCMIVKPLGSFEWRCLLEECRLAGQMTKVPFAMVAFDVESMDSFRQKDEVTREYLEGELIPYFKNRFGGIPVVLGGYSLGGLFALWCCGESRCCDAVAAGSPSLWAEWWDDFADGHPLLAEYAYLSVGNTEDHTKKAPFNRMGDCLRKQHERNMKSHGAGRCVLEWNRGGHFADIEMRKAKGWAWCMNALFSQEG